MIGYQTVAQTTGNQGLHSTKPRFRSPCLSFCLSTSGRLPTVVEQCATPGNTKAKHRDNERQKEDGSTETYLLGRARSAKKCTPPLRSRSAQTEETQQKRGRRLCAERRDGNATESEKIVCLERCAYYDRVAAKVLLMFPTLPPRPMPTGRSRRRRSVIKLRGAMLELLLGERVRSTRLLLQKKKRILPSIAMGNQLPPQSL